MTKKLTTGLATTTALLLLTSLAVAQDFPVRQIQLVVPFAPGAANDTLARILASEMTSEAGRIIVDNRPGGDTSIGTQFVKRAPADGYTLLMVSNSSAINTAIRTSLPYDIVKDFVPVIYTVRLSFFLVVNQEALPVKSAGELAAYARSYPGKLSYGTAGNGSPHHLAAELFKLRTATDMVHVPYKGMGLGIGDLLAGRIQLVITGFPAVASQMKSGKLKVLAVASAVRSALNPDVPTFKESGIEGVEVDAWGGILAPAGTPEAVIAKLNAEFNRVLHLPQVKEKLAAQGMEPVGGAPGDFGVRIRSDIEMYRTLIKTAKLRLD